MFNENQSEKMAKQKRKLSFKQLATETVMKKLKADSKKVTETQAEADDLLDNLTKIQEAVLKRENELVVSAQIKTKELKLKTEHFNLQEVSQRLELHIILKMKDSACVLEKKLLGKEEELQKKERTLEEWEQKLKQREVSLSTTSNSTQTDPATSQREGNEEIRHRYTCEYLNCGSSFKSFHELRRHSDKHTGRKYCCPTCGRVFTRQDNCDRHFRDVHMKWHV